MKIKPFDLDIKNNEKRAGYGGLTPYIAPEFAISQNDRACLAWACAEGVFLYEFDGEDWHSEKISDECSIHVSIAYDSENRLHAIYDLGSKEDKIFISNARRNYRGKAKIMHAVKQGDVWNTSIAIEDKFDDWLGRGDLALGLDSSDQPHILCPALNRRAAFTAEGGPNFHHFAWQSDNKWQNENLPKYFRGLKIIIDKNDTIHTIGEVKKPMSHHTNENYSIQYATKKAGQTEWELEQVSDDYSQKFSGKITTFDIDKDGGIHVVFMGGTASNDRATYRFRNNGEWSKPEIIERKGNNGFGSCIKIDGENNIHVIYRIQKSRSNAMSISPDPAQLHYATKTSKKWGISELKSETGWHCTMDIDKENIVHIVYLDAKDNAIKFVSPE